MNYKLINDTQKTPLETIMNNRGIKTEDIQHFLNPTQSDVYPNKLLNNMEQGIKMNLWMNRIIKFLFRSMLIVMVIHHQHC